MYIYICALYVVVQAEKSSAIWRAVRIFGLGKKKKHEFCYWSGFSHENILGCKWHVHHLFKWFVPYIPIGFPNLYCFQWIPIVGGQTHPFWHPMIWVSLTQMVPLGELMAIASRAMNDGHFFGCNCFSSWNKLKWIPNVCDFFGCPKILTVDLYVSHYNILQYITITIQ